MNTCQVPNLEVSPKHFTMATTAHFEYIHQSGSALFGYYMADTM